jgi:hypothetical protein
MLAAGHRVPSRQRLLPSYSILLPDWTHGKFWENSAGDAFADYNDLNE